MESTVALKSANSPQIASGKKGNYGADDPYDTIDFAILRFAGVEYWYCEVMVSYL